MEFEIKGVVTFDTPSVAAALLDEGFQKSLADIGPLAERTLLSQETQADGTIVRKVRCVLDLELKGMARSFIGDGDPAWVEVALWDPDANTWEWEIEPEVGGDLLQAHGKITLEPDGDETLRTVHGTVKVRVPLYGGKVEGWIVDGLERAYEEEAERLSEWLESNQ
jgi:Protein of unknown function (DUF2505)